MKAPINWSIRKETQKQQMTQKFLGEQSIVREGGNQKLSHFIYPLKWVD